MDGRRAVTTVCAVVALTVGGLAAVVPTPAVAGAGCTITGTPGDDTLLGTAGDDVICGLGAQIRFSVAAVTTSFAAAPDETP